MLTSEKIKLLRNKISASPSERIIIYLADKQGISTVDEASKSLGMPCNLIRLHGRKSFYVEIDKGKMYLRPKGVNPGWEYADPFDAETIHDFIFSVLCRDYHRKWNSSNSKDTNTICQDLTRWAKLKGKDLGQTLINKNIYQTIKKECKKYLVAFPDRKGNNERLINH